MNDRLNLTLEMISVADDCDGHARWFDHVMEIRMGGVLIAYRKLDLMSTTVEGRGEEMAKNEKSFREQFIGRIADLVGPVGDAKYLS